MPELTSTDSALPPEFSRWLRSASDLELSRAIVEEAECYREPAMVRIQDEVARRGLEVERVVREGRVAAARRIPPRSYVYGGLVLAGVGLVPAMWPRERIVRCRIRVDNAEDRRVSTRVAGRGLDVEADGSAAVSLRLRHRSVPLLDALAPLLPGSGPRGAPVRVEVDGQEGDLAPRLHVEDGGRYLVVVGGPASYVLVSRRYRREGELLVADGPPFELRIRVDVGLDLDRVPVGDGLVRVDEARRALPLRLRHGSDTLVLRRLRPATRDRPPR